MRDPATAPQSDAFVGPSLPSLTALEIFAGAGGLAMGMHQAGFEVVDLIENNEAACETLRRNADLYGWKDPDQLDARDAETIDWTSYEGADLLCAGAPCQPFSRGGKRNGKYDDRDMFGEVVKAVAIIQPRAFVIENVRGVLFESQLGYFKSILARLRRPTVEDPSTEGSEDLYWARAPMEGPGDDYRVKFQLLDAADFGLAQRRPRLFIVGLHRDVDAEFEWPKGRHSRESLIEDLRGEEYWREYPEVSASARARARAGLPKQPLKRGGARWRTLRDVLTELGPPVDRQTASCDPWHVKVPGARLYGKHTGSPIDWVGKTIKAGVHGSPGGEHIVVTSPKRFRYLTVRECATLQGFPDDFRPPEKRTPAMRQLGNAVPVAVAEAVAMKLKKALAVPPEEDQ